MRQAPTQWELSAMNKREESALDVTNAEVLNL